MNLSPNWDYLSGIVNKRLSHNKTDRHVSQYGEEIELIGAAGELAARRFLGAPETLHTGFDTGTDIQWRGWNIDVKTTRLTKNIQYRYLQWPEWKWVKSDIVLMCAVNVGTKEATVIGWLWANEVVEAPINAERDTPCHELPLTELRPPWELYAIGYRSSKTKASKRQKGPEVRGHSAGRHLPVRVR